MWSLEYPNWLSVHFSFPTTYSNHEQKTVPGGDDEGERRTDKRRNIWPMKWLSDCNTGVKANDCKDEAEMRIGAVIREAELKKQTRWDLKVEEAWHHRGNPTCLKWFVSHWDEPWDLCCLSLDLFRSISTAGSQFYTWSYKFTWESRLFLPKLRSQRGGCEMELLFST